jgi:aerobic carbon-monoxide dehydrogenase medium subunit
MYDFTYHRPTSLGEVARLAAGSEDPKILAGGMSLLPTLKQRLSRHSDLVDLAGVESLAGIRREADALIIGAMTRHADVAASVDVKEAIPALTILAEGIGDPLVRNRGTIGGSIANADPAADYPAAVLGLGATIITDKRSIPADDFFKGLFETALAPSEIIIAVRFPVPEKAGYTKFPNPASRFAIVGVFAAKTRDKTGGTVRVAVTGAGSYVFRLPDAEARLTERFAPDALDGLVVGQDGLNTDIHASAEYRAHVIAVMAKRAVAQAVGSAVQSGNA